MSAKTHRQLGTQAFKLGKELTAKGVVMNQVAFKAVCAYHVAHGSNTKPLSLTSRGKAHDPVYHLVHILKKDLECKSSAHVRAGELIVSCDGKQIMRKVASGLDRYLSKLIKYSDLLLSNLDNFEAFNLAVIQRNKVTSVTATPAKTTAEQEAETDACATVAVAQIDDIANHSAEVQHVLKMIQSGLEAKEYKSTLLEIQDYLKIYALDLESDSDTLLEVA